MSSQLIFSAGAGVRPDHRSVCCYCRHKAGCLGCERKQQQQQQQQQHQHQHQQLPLVWPLQVDSVDKGGRMEG